MLILYIYGPQAPRADYCLPLPVAILIVSKIALRRPLSKSVCQPPPLIIVVLFIADHLGLPRRLGVVQKAVAFLLMIILHRLQLHIMLAVDHFLREMVGARFLQFLKRQHAQRKVRLFEHDFLLGGANAGGLAFVELFVVIADFAVLLEAEFLEFQFLRCRERSFLLFSPRRPCVGSSVEIGPQGMPRGVHEADFSTARELGYGPCLMTRYGQYQ
jgi:hypothetical protein